MTIKLRQSSSLKIVICCAIAFTPLFLKTTIANAQTPAPQRTTSSAPKPKMDSCPAWKSLIEPFRFTSSGLPLAPRSTGRLPGVRIPEQVRYHVPINTPLTYNSEPPTSGYHYPCWAAWGIYEEAPADGFLVHNLEHGGVIISYNPELIKGQELQRLRSQALQLSYINARLILTPRSNLDAAIALTSWGYLQKLNRYNPAIIETFYNAHIARGPECEKGQCPE